MDWKPGGVSDDVEDRRSSGGGGGFSGMGLGGRGIGIGGFLVLLVLSLVFHRNLFTLISGDVSPDGVVRSAPASDSAQDPEVQFVSFVLDDVQATWQNLLPAESGRQYRHAKLVLFRDWIDWPAGKRKAQPGRFIAQTMKRCTLI
jgi:uncharacterized protein